ncbi:T9SS type A sorting domain-containing protein, partial [Candidatus Poribacteria bacterium]|nr:T9SS type A sorting domain-containing protein [Candidatus Poribacteria bacterium]
TVTAQEVQDISGVGISRDKNSAAFIVPEQYIQKWNDLKNLVVYPNPVITGSRHYGQINFDKLPSGTKIKIYDCNGNIMRILDTVEENCSKKIWYLDNDSYQKLSSGIYVYVVEYKGHRRTGKIALVR